MTAAPAAMGREEMALPALVKLPPEALAVVTFSSAVGLGGGGGGGVVSLPMMPTP